MIKTKRGTNGITLIESLMGLALLTIAVVSFMRISRASISHDRMNQVTEAISQYEDVVRVSVLSRAKHFIEKLALGGTSPAECPVAFAFAAPGTADETQMDKCFTFTLPTGISFSLIKSTSTIPTFPVRTGETQPDALPYAKYQNCINRLTIRGAAADYSGAQSLFFCLNLTAAGTLAPEYGNLRSMQPAFIEFTYFNFFSAPTDPPTTGGYKYPTVGSVPLAPPPYVKPAVMTISEIGKMYNPGGTLSSPVPPVMNYLYYTFYWTGRDGGAVVYRQYPGMFVIGNGNG